MSTNDIIRELNNLSLRDKLFIIEQILRNIRKDYLKEKMKIATEIMANDYKNNKELTEFSELMP